MAPGQRAPATGSLNLEQAGHLHGRSQEDGVEYLFPWMPPSPLVEPSTTTMAHGAAVEEGRHPPHLAAKQAVHRRVGKERLELLARHRTI